MKDPLAEYKNLNSPLPYFLKYTLVYSFILIGLSLLFRDIHLIFSEIEFYIFIFYISFYFSMWHTYFLSKIGANEKEEKGRLKIRTLRRLLGMTSKQWNSKNKTEFQKYEYYEEKSKSSMTVIALLIASSIFIFNQFSGFILDKNSPDSLNIDIILAYIGIFSTFISFTALMLSVDSLDTIFNKFSDDKTQEILSRYFYAYVANPRYIATSFLFFSMILLVALHSLTMASICIFLIAYIGYDFWFPNFMKNKNLRRFALVFFTSLPLLAKIYISYAV